ncbi:hypothetical protein TNCT_371951 [Trichonephila clavata]|uniref:Uncharacterized protein n=1 Tax=Trichonephila clavata TaxID=2740835 RepID=A0A8X6J3F1_TRICU|nr:hypothetical protein TNCT_371951 [Trichonephila clavata]
MAKRNCFNNFINSIDFRRDRKGVYYFLNKLKSSIPKVVKNPMMISNDKDIANSFAKFYAGSQRLETDVNKNQRHTRRNVKSFLQKNNQRHSVFYS